MADEPDRAPEQADPGAPAPDPAPGPVDGAVDGAVDGPVDGGDLRGDGAVETEYVTAHVVVREGAAPPAPGLRGRALALRSALPQLARNPVVVGASAAVATVAVRVAVDVARRALGAPGSATATPKALTVTGSVVHQVHVVRHVHVFHHYPYPVSWWPPQPPR